MIGFVIAFIVAIFVYQDANSRGMLGWAWALGTFALMILVLPIYLIKRSPKLT